MVINNKAYDVMKWVCLILLPAVSVFYAALDGAFGWGHADVVSTVLAATETLLGSLLGVSTVGYRKDGAA